MAASGDTSASAASSGGDSSPRAASGAEAGASGWPGRVDFYVLEDASPSARLKVACRLAEKAYMAAQSVLIWDRDAAELRACDELLWVFNDGSFVPHEMVPAAAAGDPGALQSAPVLLSCGAPPATDVDIIINLDADLPPHLARTRRIAEIIDGDETRRRAGRARFKAYRELGVQPTSHNIRSD